MADRTSDRRLRDFTQGPLYDPASNRYLVDIQLPNGRRRRKRFLRRREAERWWTQQVATIDDGTWNELTTRTATLGVAMNHYREFAKVQHRSYETYTAPILKFWESELGPATPLARVTVAEVEAIKIRRAQSRSQATVDRALQVLKAFFNWLIDHEVCATNPVRKVKLFRPNNERVRYLTPDEFERLCSAAAEIRWYLKPLIILAVVTGLRRGNLLRLRFDECDLAARVIRIQRETKNNRPITVPVNETALRVIEELAKRANGSPCLFPHLEGRQAGEAIKDVKLSFRHAVRAAGIEDFRFHDLRHTAASWMVMGHGDLHAVQQFLNHASLKMTLRYAHLAPEYLIEQSRILDRAVSEDNIVDLPIPTRLKVVQARRRAQTADNSQPPIDAKPCGAERAPSVGRPRSSPVKSGSSSSESPSGSPAEAGR